MLHNAELNGVQGQVGLGRRGLLHVIVELARGGRDVYKMWRSFANDK
jgi:hypothetical protein